jgi:hypothetical protein
LFFRKFSAVENGESIKKLTKEEAKQGAAASHSLTRRIAMSCLFTVCGIEDDEDSDDEDYEEMIMMTAHGHPPCVFV